MSLDDFASEREIENEQELRDSLDQNTPPSGAERWRDYEPGSGDWEDEMKGTEQDNKLDGSNEDTMFLVRRTSESEEYIATDYWENLSDRE